MTIPPKGPSVNVAGLATTLVPVFFVLALGYVACKRNGFDAEQTEYAARKLPESAGSR